MYSKGESLQEYQWTEICRLATDFYNDLKSASRARVFFFFFFHQKHRIITGRPLEFQRRKSRKSKGEDVKGLFDCLPKNRRL